jgi:CDP-paratose 2-epimerase
MDYKKILITGGAGFVGSNLAIFFKTDNPEIQITVLDNLKRRGSELNLKRLRENNIEFIHGDIRNKEDLDAAGSFDLMIECSAEPSVLAGINGSPEYLINTNLIGTINCLEEIRKNHADVIFLSTSRVYPIKKLNELKYTKTDSRFDITDKQSIPGVSSKGISEEFPLDDPRSLYGTTKLCSELLLQEYIDTYGVNGIINRCGVLTGPWQMGKIDQGVVVLWVARHIYGGKLSYIGYGGKGKQVRDMLHVRDLYDLLCIQLKNIKQHSGKIYNVGGGREVSVSLKELTQLCEKITKKKIDIGSITENRSADIPYYITDNSKVTRATGWKPKITPEKILKEITEWIETNKEKLRPILQ